MKYPSPNAGKKITRQIGASEWQRWPIKTPVVMPNADLAPIVKEATEKFRQPDDLILIAESVVAIAQGRAFVFDEIQPGHLARFLTKFVSKVPYGIGLGRPQTMQLAIEECGAPRILLAALVGGFCKLIGIRGMFYRLAGAQAALIDGPCDYTLPPFNKYATLGPKNPGQAAEKLSQEIGCAVAIVDANDLGTKCLGAFPKKYREHKTTQLAEELSADNPLGQSCEQTPVILCRQQK